MSNAAQKKQEMVAEQHIKAIKNLSYWNEYRERKDAIMAMFYQAKQQLAMKKVWALLVCVHAVIHAIHAKYRKKYHYQMIRDAEDFAVAKIRGLFKLSLRRIYTQYEQQSRIV